MANPGKPIPNAMKILMPLYTEMSGAEGQEFEVLVQVN